MEKAFAHPTVNLVGMNVRLSDPEELTQFKSLYAKSGIDEIVTASPSPLVGHCFELLVPDPRRDDAPALLGTFEAEAGNAALVTSGSPSTGANLPTWEQNLETTWSVQYRHISETSPAGTPPYAVLMIGINTPVDIDDATLEEFNDFYTNVHVPEGIAASAFSRNSRYEIAEEFRNTQSACPRFLAVWEADEEGTAIMLQPPATPPSYSPGPDAWRNHTTIWQSWYRMIPR